MSLEANEMLRKVVLVNYCLYLGGLLTGGLTTVIALIIAYIYRNDAHGSYLASHLTYQIRTFWIGLLYFVIANILTFILIGFLLLFVLAIWFIIRCAQGLKAVNARQPMVGVQSWLF